MTSENESFKLGDSNCENISQINSSVSSSYLVKSNTGIKVKNKSKAAVRKKVYLNVRKPSKTTRKDIKKSTQGSEATKDVFIRSIHGGESFLKYLKET